MRDVFCLCAVVKKLKPNIHCTIFKVKVLYGDVECKMYVKIRICMFIKTLSYNNIRPNAKPYINMLFNITMHLNKQYNILDLKHCNTYLCAFTHVILINRNQE